MMDGVKVAVIGLDTSHSVELPRFMLDPKVPEARRVKGVIPVACLRFPSPFQSEAGQDKRQAQLEEWGVRVTRDFDEAVDGCDALMIEINDPSKHLDYFTRCAGLGKPIFIDKPLADSSAAGRAILASARSSGTAFFSCSNLRFSAQLDEARQRVPAPEFTHVYGELGAAPSGSSIVWYGVHTFEMLQKAMGRGAASVSVHADAPGCVCTVRYPGSRRAVAELCAEAGAFGGDLRTKELAVPFVADDSDGLRDSLLQVRRFFTTGEVPVDPLDTLEVMDLLDAAQRSFVSKQEEPLSR
jgi:predicted dehydrogenase